MQPDVHYYIRLLGAEAVRERSRLAQAMPDGRPCCVGEFANAKCIDQLCATMVSLPPCVDTISKPRLSLHLQAACTIHDETMRVARATFPRGNAQTRLYDEFGHLSHDQDFAALVAPQSQSAQSSAGLALIRRRGHVLCAAAMLT